MSALQIRPSPTTTSTTKLHKHLPYTPTTRQLAVQCTRCTTAHGTSPYVDLFTNQPCPTPSPSGRLSPTHCPRCGHQRQYRSYDYADVLCTNYFGLTRALAIELIQTFNELTASDKLPTRFGSSTAKLIDPLDLISSMGLKPLLARQAITPLTITCHTANGGGCGGQFTLLRCAGPQPTSPLDGLHCVFCGRHSTLSLSISQDSTEDACWLSLSHHYDLTVQAMQFFYNDWTKHGVSSSLSLAAYLQQPEVASLVQLAKSNAAKALLSPPIVATPVATPALPEPIPVLDAPAPSPVSIPTVPSPIYITTIPDRMYNHCSICDCELPNEIRRGGLKLSLNPYCEPCHINVLRLRHLGSISRQINMEVI